MTTIEIKARAEQIAGMGSEQLRAFEKVVHLSNAEPKVKNMLLDLIDLRRGVTDVSSALVEMGDSGGYEF
jgi:hypothetical protein